jgi:hypothetical protein
LRIGPPLRPHGVLDDLSDAYGEIDTLRERVRELELQEYRYFAEILLQNYRLRERNVAMTEILREARTYTSSYYFGKRIDQLLAEWKEERRDVSNGHA